MLKFNNPNVQIGLDGLYLFSYDSKRQRGEAKIQTTAEKHSMRIRVRANGKVIHDLRLKQEQLKSIGKITIDVIEGEKGKAIKSSALAANSFAKILDLEGRDFYQRQCSLKSGKYGASIFLNQGLIEAGNIVNGGLIKECYRVKEELFESLPKKPTTHEDWDAFVRQANQKDPGSIKELPAFASDAMTNITLLPGQKLSVTHGKDGKELFPPLEFGRRYKIEVVYHDDIPPKSLQECRGFAHHCKSLKLAPKSPIFGLFRVRFKGLGGSTPSACCILGRVA